MGGRENREMPSRPCGGSVAEVVSVYCASDGGGTFLSFMAVLGDRYWPGGFLSPRLRLSHRWGSVLYPSSESSGGITNLLAVREWSSDALGPT